MKRLLQNQDGVTAVAFSIVAPVFLFFVFGFMQICFWLWANLAIQHATELAARCASTNHKLCGTQSQVQSFAASQIVGFSVPAANFNVTKATCGQQVQITYTFPQSLTFFGALFPTIRAYACNP